MCEKLGRTKTRKRYPRDGSDDERAFCAPPRDPSRRELFHGLRWFVRAGCPWRRMPHDLPPWPAVHQQAQRWVRAGCFENTAADLRLLLRSSADRNAPPSAAILDSRTLPSPPASGSRAGDDGAKKRKGSKVHAAVGTLGQLLAVTVTSANESDRAQVNDLAPAAPTATGENVKLADVDQGYTGAQPAVDATQHGLRWAVVKHTEANRGLVLLPRRWVVERAWAWVARFRRLARDDERLATTLAGDHWLAVARLMLKSVFAKNAGQALTNVTVGNGVTSIGSYAFSGCTGLTNHHRQQRHQHRGRGVCFLFSSNQRHDSR